MGSAKIISLLAASIYTGMNNVAEALKCLNEPGPVFTVLGVTLGAVIIICFGIYHLTVLVCGWPPAECSCPCAEDDEDGEEDEL